MEMWLRIKWTDSGWVRLFQIESFKEKDGEIVYQTKDSGTIYHNKKEIIILDISHDLTGRPADISLLIEP